jgi:catechol 2,3-dioxygenase-like lactoylglutathione lyase family enzyme
MIARLTQLIVYVTHMGRAIAFYRDAMGLPLVIESEHWSELAAGDVTLALHLTSAEPGSSSHTLPAGRAELQFQVGDLDYACETLRALGYTVDGPRTLGGLPTPLAFLRDPDGLSIVLSP